ncbi:MAG TPA: DUF4230 domain-containing protein [Polyangiales bacterium]|nr:DUF4230 domain-containing protein [Polyangiales bacterium]
MMFVDVERPAFARAAARFTLRQRTAPASGWRLHSGPLQTVRVNDASPPTEQANLASPPEPPKRRWALLTVAALFVAIAAFAGSALTTLAFQLITGRPSTTTTELRGGNSVVSAIRDLATLESASYHMERVIDLRDRQSHMLGLFESQDAILLVAAADVVAGIDLQSMRDGDIVIDEVRHSAQVTLPPPIVLSARLDNESTYVHTRKTDQLAIPAQSLETRARQVAEQTLREAALEAGILERARSNAAVTIKTLLRSLGFAQVEVTFRAE